MGIVFYGGLDVHRDSIAADLGCRETGEVWNETFRNDKLTFMKAVRRWQKKGELFLVYEASSAGFVIRRWCDELGVRCEVAAPAFTPRGRGDLIKTDPRDARGLRIQLSAGALRFVHVPGPEEEMIRCVVRHAVTLTQETTRVKNRILKFLGLQGLYWRDAGNWTEAHRQWLKGLRLGPMGDVVLRSHLSCLAHLEAEEEAIRAKVDEIAHTPPYARPVQWLMAFRGIKEFSAMVLRSEIGDVRRFRAPKQLMS